MTANPEPSNQGFELTGRRRFALRAVASLCDWSLPCAAWSLSLTLTPQELQTLDAAYPPPGFLSRLLHLLR